jgi:hypothetical protein
LPYGSDLDNLLKRFQDALNETIFSEAKGKDSCIISLTASKIKVSSAKEAGTFINGPDIDNAIFYKTDKFEFLSNIPIQTALRDISQFTLVHNPTNDTLIIYAIHLKASEGSSNELQRAAEIDSLRKVTNSLHSDANLYVYKLNKNLAQLFRL